MGNLTASQLRKFNHRRDRRDPSSPMISQPMTSAPQSMTEVVVRSITSAST